MKPDNTIAAQIVELIRTDRIPLGSHLPAQMLADRLRVSRTPINEALARLHGKGVLRHDRHRGYFLAQELATPDEIAQLELPESDVIADAYFQIADDRLRGELPDNFNEVLIKARYNLTQAQLIAVLGRMAQEGWTEKKPGYGWTFSSMLTTPDSLLQSYRLRLVLEPAALLEPGYRMDPEVLARCRATEQHLLDGGIAGDTADQLHYRGVRFHEALVAASGNSYFLDTIRRVNRVRRLLSHRYMQDRGRYVQHCEQHLHMLDLIEQGRQQEAAKAMRAHLQNTLKKLEKVSALLNR